MSTENKPYRGSKSLFATTGFTAVMGQGREPPDALDSLVAAVSRRFRS
jgi:hypothetical protein